ncbi:MAG TPA: BON domain-containing protein [Vicinamibacterales bacterium]|nr:BON domain-containing protein [Vicinamibacterales bacterium]
MTDRELQQHIQSALDWEPSVQAADIGVSVENGVATLRGDVESFAEKEAAERVALHVYGVRAVANDLDVRIPTAAERSDSDIAQAALNALRWHTSVPEKDLTVVVRNGWITLSGAVDWQFQRDAAVRAVRYLTGVRGVTNTITIHPSLKAGDVRGKIEEAFRRSAEIDARRVNVTVQDGKVILSGNVRSFAERQEAEKAAWAAPGVAQVDDRLTIVP